MRIYHQLMQSLKVFLLLKDLFLLLINIFMTVILILHHVNSWAKWSLNSTPKLHYYIRPYFIIPPTFNNKNSSLDKCYVHFVSWKQNEFVVSALESISIQESAFILLFNFGVVITYFSILQAQSKVSCAFEPLWRVWCSSTRLASIDLKPEYALQNGG